MDWLDGELAGFGAWLEDKIDFKVVNGVMEEEAGPVMGPPAVGGGPRERSTSSTVDAVSTVGLWGNASVRERRGRSLAPGDWRVSAEKKRRTREWNGILLIWQRFTLAQMHIFFHLSIANFSFIPRQSVIFFFETNLF